MSFGTLLCQDTMQSRGRHVLMKLQQNKNEHVLRKRQQNKNEHVLLPIPYMAVVAQKCACSCTSAAAVHGCTVCWMIFSYQYSLLLGFLYSLNLLLLTWLFSDLPAALPDSWFDPGLL